MLGWLADLFQENVVAFNRCYKFEESDIFLYREGENDYYVAFLN